MLGLLGLAGGSALGGVLATVEVTLPVAVGGIVFLLCAVGASIVLRHGAQGRVDTPVGRSDSEPLLDRRA